MLAGILFFFLYFKVDTVEVMGSSHYSDEEIKEMVLKGPMASNSALAPLLYSKKNVEDVPFVEAMQVSQVNRNTICISVKEKQPVGCVPYLDCYMYFDRTGIITESSVERDMKVPYFDGLEMDHVALDEKLPIKNESVLNTAVSLARIFEKAEEIPDHIYFDDKYNITLEYGEVKAQLGKDKYLEDKMSRLLAILPQLTGQKGILHMENVSPDNKMITFEKEITEEEKKKSENGEDPEAESGDIVFNGDEDGSYGDDQDSSEGDGNGENGWEDNGEGGNYEGGQSGENEDSDGNTQNGEDGGGYGNGQSGENDDGGNGQGSGYGNGSGADDGTGEEGGQVYGNYAE